MNRSSEFISKEVDFGPYAHGVVLAFSWPGQSKLSAGDLGLKDGEIPKTFYLGNKKLYPQEWRQLFSQLSSRARNYLNDNSYPFVVEYVRAIPKRNLARLAERLEELKAEYLARAQEFVALYESIQEQWREKIPGQLAPASAPGYICHIACHYTPFR